jgi:hypothetical protein
MSDNRSVPVPSLLTRDELREHLVATRIAGSVDTPVWDVLRKAEGLAAGVEEYALGLSGMRRWSAEEVLDQVRAQFGWSHTPGEPGDGPTWIDPELLLDELDRAAERLACAGREGQRVLLASGHPTGVLALHQRLAAALQQAGAKLLRPADGHRLIVGERARSIRYLLGVAVLAGGGNLYHTHRAEPMEAVLERSGEVDLVVADHGWAGAAAEQGIDVIGIADINDPALPMAKREGRLPIVLGMDDNVLPSAYEPVADHLAAGLA